MVPVVVSASRQRGKAFAVAVVLAITAGCAGVNGPPFQKTTIPLGKGVIYAYRTSKFAGGAIRPELHCGSESVPLAPGGYHPFIVDAGTTVCHAATETTAELDVSTTVGHETYLKEEVGWGILIGRPHLSLVDAAVAESEIGECRLQQ